MSAVQIRHLTVGEGMPKICVPIVGKNREEIADAAGRIASNSVQPDMVEFRADWCEDILKTEELLRAIRIHLENMPLLFTFRTAMEGGEQKIGWQDYETLLLRTAKSRMVDAVDVEAFSFTDAGTGVRECVPEEAVVDLVKRLHEENVVVIGSNHDFSRTPPKEELVRRLRRMRDMHMDIAKIAVMPETERDVLALLDATLEAKEEEGMCPVITMSMASKGVISRMAGELFGSVVTFASVGKASAPGQIALEQLRQVLNILHEA